MQKKNGKALQKRGERKYFSCRSAGKEKTSLAEALKRKGKLYPKERGFEGKEKSFSSLFVPNRRDPRIQ